MHGQHIKRRQTAFFNNLPSFDDVIPPMFPISFNYRCVQDAPDRYLEHPIQARSVYARWFSCYTSCRCAIQDADDFTGSFSSAASWLYSFRRSCTSCTLNSDPVFRRLPDGLFPMPYLGLAVHTIVSNLCPFLFRRFTVRIGCHVVPAYPNCNSRTCYIYFILLFHFSCYFSQQNPFFPSFIGKIIQILIFFDVQLAERAEKWSPSEIFKMN